jgi:MFS family permease
MRGPRRDRSLVGIVAEGFLSRLSFGLISFAIPLYAFELGLSLAEIGFLASLNLVVGILLKPAMGWVADRWGLLPTLTTAIALRSVVSLLLIFTAVPWQLFAIRVLHGASIAMRDPSVNALIAEHGGTRAIASSFAWYQTAKSTAGAIGKASAGLVLGLSSGSFRSVFAVAFVLSALPLGVVVRYVRDSTEAGTRRSPVGGPVAPQDRADAHALGPARFRTFPFLLLGSLISGTAMMLGNLFPLLATEYAGLSAAQVGAIYLVTAIFILTGPLWGWVSDRVSHELVLAVRGVANTLSSLIYLWSPTFGGILLGRSLDDVGKAAFRPAWGAVMARVARYDRRRRARTMGVISMGEDAGEVLGPVLAGFLWGTWGVAALLITRAALAAIVELYTLRLTRTLRTEGPSSPPDEAIVGVERRSR